MIVGLQIPSFKYPGGTAVIGPRLKEIAQTAESAGFASLWVMDHFYQIQNLFGEDYTDPMLEGYTALSYMAAVTERVTLGTLVTGVIYRHPSVLLKTASTLDVLSGGRAYFGVGAAWYQNEAEGFGIPYPATKVRFELLEDALQMARTLWDEGVTRFEGQHFSAPKMANNPAPLSQPHPKIMVGGMGPRKTLRMVAQYADACNFFEGRGAAALKSSLETLQEHCDTLGRDYDEIEKTTLGTVTLAEGKDTVDDILERLHGLCEMGFTHVIFNMTNVYDVTPLETFGAQIIPVVEDW